MQTNNNGVSGLPAGNVSQIRQATISPMMPNSMPNLHKDSNWKSADITELIKSLCKSQMEMSAVKQSKVNPFYKSSYADINDLLRSVLPVITKHGLAVTQGNRFCTETNGFYVTTTLCHISGQWLTSEVRIPMGKSGDAQAVGQMCTYGRRYGLGAILGISVTKDDDGNSLQRTRRGEE